LPKTDQDLIYDRLLADLKTAEDLVPWRKDAGVATDERFTKGGVKAYRARLAMFRGGYAIRRNSGVVERRANYLDYYKIARDECAELMARRDQHTLNPSFQSVFKDAIMASRIEPNGEVMMEVAMGGGNTLSDSKLGVFNGPVVFGRGTARLTINPAYFYSFNPLDSRFMVTCAPYQIENTGGLTPVKPYKTSTSLANVRDGKFRRDWIPNDLSSAASAWGINWPIIRFSDVLLMFAEAENEINKNPTGPAIAAYEEVRRRAFGTNTAGMGTTPTSYQLFFDAICNERGFEFGGEGLRKYDLLRCNLLHKKLADSKVVLAGMVAKTAPYNTYPLRMFFKTNSEDLIYFNSFYTSAPAASPVPAGYTLQTSWLSGIIASTTNRILYNNTPNHSEVYPIPQSVLDQSKVLKQDYGY
jgi:hypothetical protein